MGVAAAGGRMGMVVGWLWLSLLSVGSCVVTMNSKCGFLTPNFSVFFFFCCLSQYGQKAKNPLSRIFDRNSI